MLEFNCRKCGERKQKNVLPGRHAVFGSIADLNRRSECCDRPDYVDSTGFKEESLGKGLKGLVTGFKA